MVCGKCGNNNRDGAKLCAACGSPLMAAGVGRNSGPAFGSAGAVPPTIAEGAGGAQGVPPTVAEGGGAYAPRAAWVPPTVQEAYPPPPTQPERGAPQAPRTVLQDEAARPLSGWLVVMKSRTMPLYKEIPVFRGTQTIGRSAALGVHAVEDPGVSDRHVVAVGDAQGVNITDLGSSNGTVVNREKIQTRRLARGDEVRLGKTTLVFVPLPVAQPAG